MAASKASTPEFGEALEPPLQELPGEEAFGSHSRWAELPPDSTPLNFDKKQIALRSKFAEQPERCTQGPSELGHWCMLLVEG